MAFEDDRATARGLDAGAGAGKARSSAPQSTRSREDTLDYAGELLSDIKFLTVNLEGGERLGRLLDIAMHEIRMLKIGDL